MKTDFLAVKKSPFEETEKKLSLASKNAQLNVWLGRISSNSGRGGVSSSESQSAQSFINNNEELL